MYSHVNGSISSCRIINNIERNNRNITLAVTLRGHTGNVLFQVGSAVAIAHIITWIYVFSLKYKHYWTSFLWHAQILFKNYYNLETKCIYKIIVLHLKIFFIGSEAVRSMGAFHSSSSVVLSSVLSIHSWHVWYFADIGTFFCLFHVTSRELRLPGKCDIPGKVTSQKRWLPGKGDFLEKGTSWRRWLLGNLTSWELTSQKR